MNAVFPGAARGGSAFASRREREAVSESLAATGAVRNRLLDALTDEERPRWLGAMEPVRLRHGEVLYEPGMPSARVWFPCSATVSVLYATEAGASGEIALVGNEGIVGWSLLTGHGTAPCRAVVSSEGEAVRVGSRTLDAEFRRGGPVADRLLEYAEALISHTSRKVACNRHHLLEGQLCTLLLSELDRSAGRRLDLTHEWMAARLGVRREGVTAAATALRSAGAIDYRRGHIEVLDRRILEARSCGCYAAVDRGQGPRPDGPTRVLRDPYRSAPGGALAGRRR